MFQTDIHFATDWHAFIAGILCPADNKFPGKLLDNHHDATKENRWERITIFCTCKSKGTEMGHTVCLVILDALFYLLLIRK